MMTRATSVAVVAVLALVACGDEDSDESSPAGGEVGDDAAEQELTGATPLSLEEFTAEVGPACTRFADDIAGYEADGLASWEMGPAYEHAAAELSAVPVAEGSDAELLTTAMADLAVGLPELDAAIDDAVDTAYGPDGAVVYFTENGKAWAHPPGSDWTMAGPLEMSVDLPLDVMAAEDARQAAASELGLLDCATVAYDE